MACPTKPREGEPIRLIQLKSGDWRYEAALTVSAPGESRKQTRRRFETLKQTRAAVDATRTQVRRGTYQQRDATTLEQLAERWEASRVDIRQNSRDG